MSCESTIFKKISNFDDFLQKNSIPDNQRNDLIKKYKKMLENMKTLKYENFEDNFQSFVKEMNITDINEDMDELKKIYAEQLKKNDLYNDNKCEYDSIIFLSKLNDKSFSNLKIKSCFKYKTFNFNKCIRHLEETERMLIVRNEEFSDFIDKYKIYYDDDDEEHFNRPKKDVLYRKINNSYYVTNNDYFEKCTDFYFKLYSNIFSIFNLKKITLQYHNNETKMSDVNVGINVGQANVDAKHSKENKRKKQNKIGMKFNKNMNNRDNYNDFNNCMDEDEEIKFITDRMPENLKKSLYNPKCILSLIKNRTKNTLKQFHQIQSIENTDIEKIEASIGARFNLTTKLGLFANSINNTYINKRVMFILDFYDINDENEEEAREDSDSEEISDEESYDNGYSSRERTFRERRSYERNVDNSRFYSRRREEPLKARTRSLSPVNEFKAESKDEKKSEDINTEEKKEPILKWLYVPRGYNLPANKILGGSTNLDGLVYVGKIKKSPGKVNTDKGKVWNYWVQNMSSSSSGFMLLTNYAYEWKTINRGDPIPVNAVYCGKDEHNDCVWVGKSNDDEPGKITCIKNHDPEPRMQNLWCHSSWTGSKSAYILVIKRENSKHYEEIEEQLEEEK